MFDGDFAKRAFTSSRLLHDNRQSAEVQLQSARPGQLGVRAGLVEDGVEVMSCAASKITPSFTHVLLGRIKHTLLLL